MLRAIRSGLALLAIVPTLAAAQPIQTASFRDRIGGFGLTMTGWREDVGDGTTRHWLTGTTPSGARVFGAFETRDLLRLRVSQSLRLNLGGGAANYLVFAVTASDQSTRHDFMSTPITTATGAPLPWFTPGVAEFGVPWSLEGTFGGSYESIYLLDPATGATIRDQDMFTSPVGFEATNVVPEPSTWALMGTGLLALGGVAAQQRKRSAA